MASILKSIATGITRTPFIGEAYRKYWNSVTKGVKNAHIKGRDEGKTTPVTMSTKKTLSKKTNLSGGSYGGSGGYGGGGGYSGGGSVGGQKIDLTPYIKAIKEGVEANKKTLRDSYASQRNQLSQALKAYQENTATARKQQTDAFNSSRADLEEQAFMNNRAARQSAAARGIGGSGLQQLSQLSSQIQSSKQTSDLAKENTNTQNELTKALKDYQEKTNTQINDLNKEEANKITALDKEAAQQIANQEYNEMVRFINSLGSGGGGGYSGGYSGGGRSSSSSSDTYNGYLTALQQNTDSGVNALKKTYNKYKSKGTKELTKQLNKTYKTYANNNKASYVNAGLGVGDALAYRNIYTNQLKKAFNKYIK